MTATVEIYGGDFKNRGGQLMLYAVLQRLRHRRADIRCAIDGEPDSPFAARAGYGLFTLCPSFPRGRPRFAKRIRPLGRILSRVVDRETFATHGLVGSNQCDAVLDISGYAYGDKWPVLMANQGIARFRDYHKRGRPVILMPQMLGPFEKPTHAEVFRKLAAYADPIYARDDASYRSVLDVLPDMSDRIRQFPDLTIEVKPDTFPDGFSLRPEDKYVTVVPNMRMLDRTSDAWRAVYVDLMRGVVEYAQSAGFKVVVMQHEAGKGDAELVEMLSNDATIRVDDPDPRKLKAVLAGSQLAVCSRFHAVVSALSSGTPCLTLGWAHKYQMIHRDFDLEETSLGEAPSAEAFRDALPKYFDEVWLAEAAARVTAAKQGLLDKLDVMWDEVYARLGI